MIQKKSSVLSKLRRVVSKYAPINIATLVWMSIIIFPALLTISNYTQSETQVTYNLWMSGGLSSFTYQYIMTTLSGSYYPYLVSSLTFSIVSGINVSGLLLWSLNLLLGVTTLRFITGKSTKKRVRRLAIVIILIYTIPSLMITVPTLLSGLGFYTIPLPFYPLMMLLVARFVKAPTEKQPSTEDLIHVPLRTRISSVFMRGKNDVEISDVESVPEEDTEISDQ